MTESMSMANPLFAQVAVLWIDLAVAGGLLALAVVPAWRRRSWRTLGRALVVVFFGVGLPVGVFFLSAAFMPESKAGSPHGWIDAFHEGKLALAPLVLWATASLYAWELRDRTRREPTWAAPGIVVGAVVSLVCLVHGAATIPLDQGGLGFVFPLYVALWYALRSAQVLRARIVRPAVYLSSLLGSVPFWIYSVMLSRQLFSALPENPPECFVVSAAARGHARVVGSRQVVDRGGRTLAVNAQLAVFWRLEDLGRRRAPGLHSRFRRVYDVWGYRASRLVRGPWTADVVYCALKPLELVARGALAVAGAAGPADR